MIETMYNTNNMIASQNIDTTTKWLFFQLIDLNFTVKNYYTKLYSKYILYFIYYNACFLSFNSSCSSTVEHVIMLCIYKNTVVS